MLALSRLKSSRLSFSLLQARSLLRSAEAEETGTVSFGTRTVCFADPSLLLTPHEASQTAAGELAKTHFFAKIPSSLANKLHEAKFTLGDGDTPEGTWVVGKQGELFEYTLAGVHIVRSGFSSALKCADSDSNALPAIPESEHDAIMGMMQRDARASAMAGGSVLFLGELVDCETAAVYIHKKGTSLLISSNHEGF